MTSLHHQPFIHKIKTGVVTTHQSGSAVRNSGSYLSIFSQSSGASPATISVSKDEANIITSTADTSTDGTYITVPTNAEFIRICAGAFWEATASAVGTYRLSIRRWLGAGSYTDLSLVPGQTQYDSSTGSTGCEVHITVETGFQRVGSTELIQPGFDIVPVCYQNTGSNLQCNSVSLELNYMTYEVVYK